MLLVNSPSLFLETESWYLAASQGWPGTYCYASVSLVQGSQVYVARVGLLSSFLRGEGRVGGFN